jgi:hydrogenase expression/formation protein HypC
MCLGIPVRMTMVEGRRGEGEIGGIRREVDLSLISGVKPGDYVILHAGFAIEKIHEEEAEETLRLLREISGFSGEDA